MRHFIFGLGILCASLFVFVPNLSAQSRYPDYQDLYVNDFADVLLVSQEAEIRDTLSQLKNETGVEATVLTVESFKAYGTGDSTIESFSTNLFNEWGIGDSETNTGILLLLAIEERGIRIETGIGWESRIQDETDQIIELVLVPNLRNGDFGDAMVEGTNAIAEAARQELLPATPTPEATATRKVLSTRIVSTRVEVTYEEVPPVSNRQNSGSSSSSGGSGAGLIGFFVLAMGALWGYLALSGPVTGGGGRMWQSFDSSSNSNSWGSNYDDDDDFGSFGGGSSGGGGSFDGGHSSGGGSSGDW